ncbi:hypothetical protein HY464_00535 [Candidatus Peregrinibacteria bacterium]|nr:hypothetical protein [Candidatus Peregrinibacteria bacterium]MBI2523931.1 hypothetical protein [Candidatus Peregrinibacteria bacterium]MBI4129160.1 hypothetical protein [Candidatus Peregrinibacteria bacterium]
MDGFAPATKDDVQVVQRDVQVVKADMQVMKTDMRSVQQDVQGLKVDVQRLERKFERLYETDDQILTILGNIDKRLTPKLENHERRITRLEEVMV